ncbi:unnamed protein product [Schistosoma curassoni]|nr:unnamed protein product [Schistosoma curassoni]
MRHSFATGQFILLYSIIVLIFKFFDCHDICTKPELRKYEKVIFESDAYSYSHHYYYSRMIRSDQSPPIVSGTFERLVDTKDIDAKFPFTFYGSQVVKFRILTTGRIEMYDKAYSGVVRNYVRSGYYVKTDISDRRELLAVRMSYYPDAGGENCPKYDSTEACHGSTPPKTRCIWCETANMCITRSDEDTYEFKVNGCKNKVSD